MTDLPSQTTKTKTNKTNNGDNRMKKKSQKKGIPNGTDPSNSIISTDQQESRQQRSRERARVRKERKLQTRGESNNHNPTTNTNNDELYLSDDEEEIKPGPVFVPGINSRNDSTRSLGDTYKSLHETSKPLHPELAGLQTAIMIDEEEQANGAGLQSLDDCEKQKIIDQAQSNVRAKAIATAVVAEATDLDIIEKKEKKRRQRSCLIILFIVLLVGGGTTGTVIAVSNKKDGNTSKVDDTLMPTLAPTVKPPIFGNGDDDYFPSNGDVDFTTCESALDMSEVIGTPFFGEITNDSTIGLVDTCDEINSNGLGVWYRFDATSVNDIGQRMVASTCDNTSIDTQISIFSGSACSKLQCVAGRDQSEFCGNGDQSRVAFETLVGETYYIYVHGKRSSLGLFELLVAPLEFNNECEDAKILEYGGSPVFGSTKGATPSANPIDCEQKSATTPGVWYKMEAPTAEQLIELYLTADDRSATVSYLVFQGNDCGTLRCITTLNSPWTNEPGEVYYVLVYSTSADKDADFHIYINEPGSISLPVGRPDENAVCEGSSSLIPGERHMGITTWSATSDLGSCGNMVFATSKGVWYNATGTGGILTASTCDFANFDTQISVFRGDCDALVCVDGNDQACDDQSSVSWLSEEDVTYYIYVHGFGDATGNFELYLEAQNYTSTNECSLAVDLSGDGATTQALAQSDASSEVPSYASVISSDHPGSWYKVTGRGRSMTASTCGSSDLLVSSNIGVFVGDCGGLVCVETSEVDCGNHKMVSWHADEGIEYYLYFEAWDSDVDTAMAEFSFYVEETSVNDRCSNAIGAISVDGSSTFGSTRSSRVDESLTRRGLWYTVIGDGSGMAVIASTSSEYTEFDAEMSVYVGDCDSLMEVEVENVDRFVGIEGDMLGSTVRFDLGEDELAYIYVNGGDADLSEVGNFALSFFAAA